MLFEIFWFEEYKNGEIVLDGFFCLFLLGEKVFEVECCEVFVEDFCFLLWVLFWVEDIDKEGGWCFMVLIWWLCDFIVV